MPQPELVCVDRPPSRGLCLMGALDAIAARVAAAATVEVQPSGSSMAPLIHSRRLVTVAPVDLATVEVGDIVLAQVAATVYLHLRTCSPAC